MNYLRDMESEVMRLKKDIERQQAELKRQGADLAGALLNSHYKAGWEDGYKTALARATEAGGK